MIPSGLISISSGARGARSTSFASGENASEESPWNDVVQSTLRGSSSTTGGLSDSPVVRSSLGSGVGASELYVVKLLRHAAR